MCKQVSFDDILNEIKDMAKDVTPPECGKHVHIGLMHSCAKAKKIDLATGGGLTGSQRRKEADRLHFLCPGHFEIDGQTVKCGCWCHRNLR
jgi:hypothetical protein